MEEAGMMQHWLPGAPLLQNTSADQATKRTPHLSAHRAKCPPEVLPSISPIKHLSGAANYFSQSHFRNVFVRRVYLAIPFKKPDFLSSSCHDVGVTVM